MSDEQPWSKPSDPSQGPNVLSGELPRFVELLRMSQGPVEPQFEHCGVAVEIEEIEELEGEAQYDTSNPIRAIYTCKRCHRFFWGWWD